MTETTEEFKRYQSRLLFFTNRVQRLFLFVFKKQAIFSVTERLESDFIHIFGRENSLFTVTSQRLASNAGLVHLSFWVLLVGFNSSEEISTTTIPIWDFNCFYFLKLTFSSFILLKLKKKSLIINIVEFHYNRRYLLAIIILYHAWNYISTFDSSLQRRWKICSA